MKIFLDANILVAVLNKEYPLFTYASRILSLADKGENQLFTSPVCLAIAFYFSEKKSGTLLAGKKIQLLCTHLKITTVNHSVVQKTLDNPKVHDFEDGLEYYSAIESGCSCIISENLSDFYFSEIEVMNSRQFLREKFAG